MDFGPFAVAIAFWTFVAIATVAGIVADYKKRQAALEPLRAAIEKGQQLDPELVERLMAPARRRASTRLPWVCGVILVSAGVGVGLFCVLSSPGGAGSALARAGWGRGVVVALGRLLVAARIVQKYKGTRGNGK